MPKPKLPLLEIGGGGGRGLFALQHKVKNMKLDCFPKWSLKKYNNSHLLVFIVVYVTLTSSYKLEILLFFGTYGVSNKRKCSYEENKTIN